MTANNSMLKLTNLILISMFLGLGFETNAQNETKKSFIPLTIGNYWIYSSTSELHPHDTLKIVGTKVINGDTAFVYNTGELIFERNDSVFDYQSQRNGISFKCFEYFPSDNDHDYNIIIGGDAEGSRTVSKIAGLYKMNGKEYLNCYKFEEHSDPENQVIICKGVGIIRIEAGYYIKTLIEYKVRE